MCTIIGGFIEPEVSDGQFGRGELSNLCKLLIDLCLSKGGDYTSVQFFDDKRSQMTFDYKLRDSESTRKDFKTFIEKMLKAEKEENGPKLGGSPIPFLIFSRLTPEMENDKPKILQPYETVTGKYVTAHGTIPLKNGNFEEIIDTEILRFDIGLDKSLEKVQLLNGKVALIEFNPDTWIFTGVHNGLGLEVFEKFGAKFITNISLIDGAAVPPMKYFALRSKISLEFTESLYNKYGTTMVTDLVTRNRDVPEVIISLCSGGMDTILSTYAHIKNQYNIDSNNKPLIDVLLMYFDWGTVAGPKEIESVKEFKELLHVDNLFEDKVFVEAKTVNVKTIFKGILDIAGLDKVRLMDSEATGKGKEEAEEAISYVPFRNTYLLLMAATFAEQYYPNKRVDFVLGANLTEGMVYLDNSTNYIAKMNQLVRIAGQKSINFKVVAPYGNVTKTRMLETFKESFGYEILERLMNIAFSCYFPVNGEACGKCGSCLLRNKAVTKLDDTRRSKNIIVMNTTQKEENE